MKQPVPYVFLALPGSKARLAERGRLLIARVAGDRNGGRRTSRRIGLAEEMAGRQHLRQHGPRNVQDRSSSSSQSSVCMLKSSVRLALLTSVTCRRPPVSRQIRNESTVPNRTSPRSARPRRPVELVQQVLDLRAGEIGVDHQPGLVADQSDSRPSAFSRSQMPALTRLCQTIALATGRPVSRSHRMVVSR